MHQQDKKPPQSGKAVLWKLQYLYIETTLFSIPYTDFVPVIAVFYVSVTTVVIGRQNHLHKHFVFKPHPDWVERKSYIQSYNMISLSVVTEFNDQQNFSTSTEFFFFPFVLQPAETVIVNIWLVSGPRQTPNRKAHVWDERGRHSLHRAEEPFNAFLHGSSRACVRGRSGEGKCAVILGTLFCFLNPKQFKFSFLDPSFLWTEGVSNKNNEIHNKDPAVSNVSNSRCIMCIQVKHEMNSPEVASSYITAQKTPQCH